MYSKVKRKSAIISKEKALTAHNQILDHNIADIILLQLGMILNTCILKYLNICTKRPWSVFSLIYISVLYF